METNKTKRCDIYSIDPRNIIVADGFNSRYNFGDIDELAAQIKEQGMLSPITVQTVKTPDGDKYQLVDGERRYRAVLKLLHEGVDIPYVKAIIIPANTTKVDLYVQQAMRNEGKNFNEYEWAILADKMRKECGITTTSEIARLLGKNTGVVTYWLKILTMPEDFQELVRTGRLCGSDLRRILQANDKDYDAARKDIQFLEEKAKEREEKKNKASNTSVTEETKTEDVKEETKTEEVKEETKPAPKLSLKDLDFGTNTKAFKDSKTITNALKLLLDYAQRATNKKELEIDVNLFYEQLKNGKLITDVIKEHQRELRKAQ